MKQVMLLLAMSLLLTVQPCGAQTGGKFYIDGRETTQEEVFGLPAEHIKTMTNSVEQGCPVLRVTLKTDSDCQTQGIAENTKRSAAIVQHPDSYYEQTTRLKEGDHAVDFTTKRYIGEDVTLSTLHGKVVLLTFWATWCAPCLRELSPEALPKAILERFADNDDFVFLPIAYTDSQQSLDRFFSDSPFKSYSYLKQYTVADPDKTIFSLYATEGVPRSFVIGRDGRILLGSLGASTEELNRIASAISTALAE